MRVMKDERYDRLTLEIDAYIRQYLCSEGLRYSSFATYRLGTDATEPSIGGARWALDFLLEKLEPTFSESLMELIEKKGRTPAEIYTKAGVTKSHFAKIKADKDYHPSKETALAFAVVLHLGLKETAELIKRAGYTLSHSNESDLIVEYFITKGIYSVDSINEQLCLRGHKPLTNWRKLKDE